MPVLDDTATIFEFQTAFLNCTFLSLLSEKVLILCQTIMKTFLIVPTLFRTALCAIIREVKRKRQWLQITTMNNCLPGSSGRQSTHFPLLASAPRVLLQSRVRYYRIYAINYILDFSEELQARLKLPSAILACKTTKSLQSIALMEQGRSIFSITAFHSIFELS